MDPKIKAHISKQPLDRHDLLSRIHELILKNDSNIVAAIEPMMGKEMIIYKQKGMMKYGLASPVKYMSLHVLPIYMSPELSDKYKALLPKAKFQKGCINFESAEEVPLDILKKLITQCSPIDLVAIREKLLAERKLKAKANGKSKATKSKTKKR